MLYFDNLSGDTADAYLADGLTEEMIVRLGSIERLSVKSRTAVQRFRGRPIEDLAAVGRGLGVAHLVSGSVRRSGVRLRVTVELVRAATGARVWGDTYDRTDSDLLELEGDIARAVATSIAGRLLPAEQAHLGDRPTKNPQAYDLYLRGNHNLAQRTPSAVARAIREFEAATRLDSMFARAEARAAISYAIFPAFPWPYTGLSQDSVLALSTAAAARALRIDSASSDAWMARGFLLATSAGSKDSVREAFDRALSLDPGNDEAWHLYGVVEWGLGEDGAAEGALRRALRINPLRPITLLRLAELHWQHGTYAEARRLLDSAIAVDPEFYVAYWDRAMVRLHAGETDAARIDAEASLRLGSGDPLPMAAIALVTAGRGDSTAARAWLDRLWRSGPDSLAPSAFEAIQVAHVLVALGERDRAVDVLERVRDPWLWTWTYSRFPEFDDLLPIARFQRYLAAVKPAGAR